MTKRRGSGIALDEKFSICRHTTFGLLRIGSQQGRNEFANRESANPIISFNHCPAIRVPTAYESAILFDLRPHLPPSGFLSAQVVPGTSPSA